MTTPPNLWVDVTTRFDFPGRVTGILRALAQITHHWLKNEALPVRLCRYHRGHDTYRAVTPAEYDALTTLDRRPGTRLRWPLHLPHELRRAVGELSAGSCRLGRLVGRAAARLSRLGMRRARQLLGKEVLPPFAPGDVVFVAGAVWEAPQSSAALARLREALGLRVALLVYDLTPLRLPFCCPREFTDRFQTWLPSALAASDVVLTISEHTRRDLLAFAARSGQRFPPVEVLRLGDEPGLDSAESAPEGIEGPFVLLVSSIGTHKNQALALHVWRRLIEKHGSEVPRLLLVGGSGHGSTQLLADLGNDPVLSRYVLHLPHADDRQLRWLYRRCLFTLYPSHYEGWGLPVAESFVHGKLCICSGAASLPEVGGHLAEYHDPLDGPTLQLLVERALFDPSWLAAREEAIRREYRTTTWLQCARQTFDLLDRHLGLTSRPTVEAA